MKPTLRPHHLDSERYLGQISAWESVVDGEEAGTERAELRASLHSGDPKALLAHLYGWESWERFEDCLRKLPEDDPFVVAWRAIESGDADSLARALDSEPGIVAARGPDGATLLDHAIWKTDQGDWSWPPGPGQEAEKHLRLVELVLDAGADVEQTNFDGWAPLHSAAYVGWLPPIELLLARGARIDRSAKGDGGTPLVLALFWGHRAAAERLAREGLVPLNLRVAAGLGRVDLLDSAGGGRRDFYRPHPGFVAWQPTDDPAEIRDEAMLWACRSGRLEVLARIGGDVNAEIGGTTPLLAAAGAGHTDCVRWLLDHDAELAGTAAQWPDATPLHAAAWFGHLDTVQLLVERGARCDLRDSEHDGTPIGWAAFHGNAEVAEWLARNAALDVFDAAAVGDVERLRDLLTADPSSVQALDAGGSSALHHAAAYGKSEAVDLLLDFGVDPAIRNQQGSTAAELADQKGFEGLATRLLT